MNREFVFSLGKSLANILEKPLRNQLDLVRLLFETAREIINTKSDTKKIINDRDITDEVIKIIYPTASREKMQRAFFFNKYPEYNGKSMYTIQSSVFPFKIMESDTGEIHLWYKSSSVDIEIDSMIISQVIAAINIIDNKELTWEDDWIGKLMELFHGSILNGEELFYIINDFLTFDFGYLRFDNDPKHENENHPRYHIDIHLDNKATYKLGLYGLINTSEFIDLLDNSTRIRFIEK